ncbi:MAG TPA: efflux RND transporter permease subunit [Phycisphaerales bacterium]|nr:efflux RND transporter permease subunit [Phycisphaerales bacterium]
MKSFTDIFIRKPVLAVVVNLVIVLMGWRAATNLPVRQYPRIEQSKIIITTVYIGASAETVRGFLTTPIERAVSAISGIDSIESASTPGVSTITINLRTNENSNDALAEINARLNQVRSELPPEAESPSVDIQRADRQFATFYVSFVSDNMDLTQLTDYLTRHVQPEFATIEHVQRVGIEGARNVAMRVWLDVERMNALDVTPRDVWQALQRNNYVAAVGRTKSADAQIDLVTDTDLRRPEEFEQLIVREQEGTFIRLRDVARIELGSEEPVAQAGMDGGPAVYVSVWPLPRANELEVAGRLREVMKRIEPTLPAGMKMGLAYDGTYYMSNALKEISRTLVETVAIVALVVFLFMGSIRSVLVPLVAIPISLIGACLMMTLLGFSLNLLTLLAIVLSVGLVVDDAIVMVENVERHIREGRSRFDAAIIGARELVGPVIAMTITLAAVYAPIGFQGGLTGFFFREFAFTLASAVVVSGIVALTLSPVMASRLAVEHGKENRFVQFVNRQFDRLRGFYGRVLDVTLPLRWEMAIIAVLIAAAAWPMYVASKKELAPTEDEGGIFFIVQSAPESTLEGTQAGATRVANALKPLPETNYVWSVTFGNNGFGGVHLVDWKKRQRTTEEIQGHSFGLVAPIAGVRAIPILPPPLPGAGQFDVELVVTSNDPPDQMAKVAEGLVDFATKKSGKFMYADTDLKMDLPQMRVEIDRTRVADMGLDLASVGQDMAILLAGGWVNRFNHEGRSYKVIPQIAEEDRQRPEQLLQLKVRTPEGGLVSALSFTNLKSEVGPRSLNRFQQRDSFRVQGVVAPGVTKDEALTALEDAARAQLPPGYAIDYAGESRQLRREGSSLVVTLGFALVLIYLVLAAQFSSFRDPLIVLLGSVPLAITGALVFTYLGLTTINIYSQVGLITLVGLVAKNGILIVEFANTLQEQGKSKFEAAKEAAMTRLRPILMTSVATVLGHFPLVLVTGAGAEARNSIGIVLVAGMTVSTLFTLFVVPSIYMLIGATHVKHAPRPEPAPVSPRGAPAAA